MLVLPSIRIKSKHFLKSLLYFIISHTILCAVVNLFCFIYLLIWMALLVNYILQPGIISRKRATTISSSHVMHSHQRWIFYFLSWGEGDEYGVLIFRWMHDFLLHVKFLIECLCYHNSQHLFIFYLRLLRTSRVIKKNYCWL